MRSKDHVDPKSGRKQCLLLERIGKDKSHFAKGSFHVKEEVEAVSEHKADMLFRCSLPCDTSLVNTILVKRFREVSITLTFREKSFRIYFFPSRRSLEFCKFSLSNTIDAGKNIKFTFYDM